MDISLNGERKKRKKKKNFLSAEILYIIAYIELYRIECMAAYIHNIMERSIKKNKKKSQE